MPGKMLIIKLLPKMHSKANQAFDFLPEWRKREPGAFIIDGCD